MKWIHVNEQMPTETVMVAYRCKYGGQWVTEQAIFVKGGETPWGEWWASEDAIPSCIDDYGYVIEGWYTSSYSVECSYPIEGDVLYWMPKVEPPESN